MCSKALVKKQNKIKLGGPGKKTEIDESNYKKKPKNHAGCALKIKDKWVTGAYGPIQGFEHLYGILMELVEHRDIPTLNKFALDTIAAGSRIDTDSWKGYNRICRLSDREVLLFDHKKVNHTDQFVDPDTGACTNGIEGK